MSNPRLFLPISASLAPLGGRVFDPLRVLDSGRIGVHDLAFGYFMGMLPASAAREVAEAAERAGAWVGRPLLERQSPIDDDRDQIVSFFESLDAATVFADVAARRRWLHTTLGLLLKGWDAGVGDPLLEASEFFGAWDDEGMDAWQAVRPRGWDALVFGSRAERRFLERVRKFLARE